MQGGQIRDKEGTFSSESVTEGHPDKVADQISDGVLDAILKDDPLGRVACEVMCTTGMVMVAGEITTVTYVDIPQLARNIVKEIGYTRAKYGFDGDTCAVLTAIDEQSEDIRGGVDTALEVRDHLVSEEEIAKTGAGDQGMMTGFACTRRGVFFMAIALAHSLDGNLPVRRRHHTFSGLTANQVTLEYEDGKAVRADTIVISISTTEATKRRSGGIIDTC